MLAVLVGVLGGVTGTAHAAGTTRAPTEFTGGAFSCLQYTNGLGDASMGRMQTDIAHMWILGYLAGYYKGKGNLEFSEDVADAQALDTLIETRCKEVPQAPILAIALQSIASEPHKLPKVVMGQFSPPTYTCGQHLDAKAGASSGAATADLAEMWAFAFIQGFKNVSSPDLEINIENKPALTGALIKACTNAKDKLFIDYAALVAEKVKMGG